MVKFLALLLLVTSATLFGQTAEESDGKLPWPNTFALSYYHVNLPGLLPQDAFGYNGEYMLGNHWGIEWSLAGGGYYAHAGIGSVMGPIAILFNNSLRIRSGGLFFVALIFTATEQTNYHIPLARGVELVPFVSLAKWRSVDSPGYPEDGTGSWSAGLRLSLIHREKWFLNLSGELGRLYHEGTPTIVLFGVNIGFIGSHTKFYN